MTDAERAFQTYLAALRKTPLDQKTKYTARGTLPCNLLPNQR